MNVLPRYIDRLRKIKNLLCMYTRNECAIINERDVYYSPSLSLFLSSFAKGGKIVRFSKNRNFFFFVFFHISQCEKFSLVFYIQRQNYNRHLFVVRCWMAAKESWESSVVHDTRKYTRGYSLTPTYGTNK